MVRSLLLRDDDARAYRRSGSYDNANYSAAHTHDFTVTGPDDINTGARYFDPNPGSIYACADANYSAGGCSYDDAFDPGALDPYANAHANPHP